MVAQQLGTPICSTFPWTPRVDLGPALYAKLPPILYLYNWPLLHPAQIRSPCHDLFHRDFQRWRPLRSQRRWWACAWMSATSQPGRHVSVITWAHLYVTRQSLLGSVYNRPRTFASLCVFFSPAAGLCRSHRLSNWSYDGLQGDGMMLHQHDTFRLAQTTIGLVGTDRPPLKVRHTLQRLQLFSGMV